MLFRSTLPAEGLLVTPGWVDIHTHYDGQATWDPYMTPSSWHGVTTAIMGNCGVGFAPAIPERHQWLIELMEGVEDIPGSAMVEGMTWEWESFPEYLDALERKPHVIDFGTQIAHGALRAFVMGDRGANNEVATADDIALMSKLTEEALARSVVGDGRRRMPPSWACFGVAVMLALVAAWPFVLLGRPEEPWAQSVTYAVAGVFVARGVAGFTPTWKGYFLEIGRAHV